MQPIRAAELVGALSLATDLGTGQPLEHALRTAVLAVRLGELVGASEQELADTYYVALLHASGCTSNSHEATQLFGEDIMHRAAFFLIDPADPDQVLAFYRNHVGPGRPTEVRERMIEAALSNPMRARESFAAMCEVAQRFARWLELGPGIDAALEYVFARWDGKGPPGGVGGEALPLPARLLHVARDYSLFLSAADADDARTVLEQRGGAAYDPRLAELAVRNFDDVCAELDETRMWEHALESEPFPQVRVSGDAITRPTWPTSPRPPPGAWACRLRPLPSCAAPRSRRTLAASASRTRFGRNLGRSGSVSGSVCACTHTSPSGRSPSPSLSRPSAWSPAPTTSGSTARATTGV
jgi:hypothetical protein